MKKEQHISPSGPKSIGPSGDGLAAKVVGFGYFLKERGFRVYQSGIQDALRSLETIDIHQKQEFFNALRANLVSSDLEWAQFPRLFDHYWQMVVKEGKRESESITDTEKEQKVKQPEKRPTTTVSYTHLTLPTN